MHQHLMGREQLDLPQQCHDRRAHSTMKQRGELHLLGAVPSEAPKEPPRREQWPPAERPAKHLYEHHCAWDHQRPAPVLLLPEHLLGHGGVRHDTHAPRPRRIRLLQSVGAATVEREELLGKQCGKAVGTDGDVEARLGAGDHDPDHEVPGLRFIEVAFSRARAWV
jgi:hypothetical protein